MLLRTKLIFCFSAVLALTMILAYTSWNGLQRISRLTKASDYAQSGLEYIDTARIYQMSITSNSAKKSNIAEVLATIESSITAFTVIIPCLTIKTNIDAATNLTRNLEASKKDLQLYQDLVDKVAVADKTLAQMGISTLAATDAIYNLLDEDVKIALSQASFMSNNILAQDTQQNMAEAAFLPFKTMTEANNALHQTRLSTLTFNLNPSEQSAQNVKNNLEKVSNLLKQLQEMLTESGHNSAMTILIDYMVKYGIALNQLVSATLGRNNQQTIIDNTADRISEEAKKLYVNISKDMNSTSNIAQRDMYIATISALILSIVLAFWLTSNTLKLLGRDPGQLNTIARRVIEGDFNIDDGQPKGGVYENLVSMVANLKTNIETARNESTKAMEAAHKAAEAVKEADVAKLAAQSARNEGMLAAAHQLEDIVEIISSASLQLAKQIEDSEAGSTEQANRVAETATAMKEMNNTVLEVARNAGSAADLAKKTRIKAEEGAQIVNDSVKSVQQVQSNSLALKQDMQTLSQYAQSISQIMSVISDIADQTNLLALNAAIEAARAGDAGRGFAVVADEVRKLAEKTMASTSDVAEAVHSIQQSVEKNMKQVDLTVSNVELTTTQAENSGKALLEIVKMVDASSDQVNAIATASEQQSATSEEINHSLGQVSIIANNTALTMQQAAKAVNNLNTQSHALTNLINELKKA